MPAFRSLQSFVQFQPSILLVLIVLISLVSSLCGSHRKNRLHSKVNQAQGTYVDGAIWGIVEPAVGIISCSMPIYNYMFTRALQYIKSKNIVGSFGLRKLPNSHAPRTLLVNKDASEGRFIRLPESFDNSLFLSPQSAAQVTSASNKNQKSGTFSEAGQEFDLPLQQIQITNDVEVFSETRESPTEIV